MNNSRFTLDGKHQTFPISEDCLILNIYSPAEAPSGAGRPVSCLEGPVHPASTARPDPSPPPLRKRSRSPQNALSQSMQPRSLTHGCLCRSWCGSTGALS